MVADETHLLLLVKVQSELCRYMLARQRRISLRALLLLLQGFTTMERLATDHSLSASSQRGLVARLVAAYLSFKRSLADRRLMAAGKTAAGEKRADARRQGPAPDTAGRGRAIESGLKEKAYYLIPAGHVDGLQEAVRSGFEALRALIEDKKKSA
jgi:hypothetical protein